MYEFPHHVLTPHKHQTFLVSCDWVHEVRPCISCRSIVTCLCWHYDALRHLEDEIRSRFLTYRGEKKKIHSVTLDLFAYQSVALWYPYRWSLSQWAWEWMGDIKWFMLLLPSVLCLGCSLTYLISKIGYLQSWRQWKTVLIDVYYNITLSWDWRYLPQPTIETQTEVMFPACVCVYLFESS